MVVSDLSVFVHEKVYWGLPVERTLNNSKERCQGSILTVPEPVQLADIACICNFPLSLKFMTTLDGENRSAEGSRVFP